MALNRKKFLPFAMAVAYAGKAFPRTCSHGMHEDAFACARNAVRLLGGFALVSLGLWVFSIPAHAQTPLPNGPGKAVVERMCTKCHGTNEFTGQRQTEQQWSNTVQDMISRGAVGTDQDVQQVVAYLTQHYGKGSSTAAVPPSTPAANTGPEPMPTVMESKVSPGPTTGVTYNRILHANDEPQNWLTYGGTYRSLHYSLLKQITPDNVKNLQLKWVFQTHRMGLDPYETTPLVVNGVMYTMQADDVVALDARTGRLFWIFNYTPSPSAILCCGVISRGLAILGHTLYMSAIDDHLVAIDARTGKPLWDTTVAPASAGYTMTGAPLVVHNTVIVGVAGGEYGIRGFVAAYDAHNGKEVWRFQTIPGPGQPGNDTWGDDSWKQGGGPTWLTGSYDPTTNLIFWGVGNPGPDYNGDVRPGDNLYTCSMIALDADTGKLKWYYQANPHNEFDWDAVQVPLLADITWQGKPRKVILWADRNGFFYVLDRTNGKFLLGKAFVKQNWNIGFDKNGRPIMGPNTKSSTTGTRIFPDNQGGTNWFNPSFSPLTGLFYVNSRDNYSTLFVKGTPKKYEPGDRYDGRGRLMGGRPPTPVIGANTDEYTALKALDPHTGEMKWQYKLNTGNSLHTFYGWQTTFGAAGVLTTASNVLFTGGREGNFVALDARNGSLLWQATLGGPLLMNPITYEVDGKQYVAINAGTSLFVFGLR